MSTDPEKQQPPAPYPDPQGQPPPQAYPPQQPAAYPPQQPAAYPPQQPAAYPPQQPAAYPPQQQPPPYSQPPPPQQQTSTNVTVVQTQPTVVTAAVFRTYPVTVTDSNGQQVQTVLEYRSGILVWIVCCVVFWITLELGLCCLAIIPFCINDLKDVYHITPTDGKVVGVYKRI